MKNIEIGFPQPNNVDEFISFRNIIAPYGCHLVVQELEEINREYIENITTKDPAQYDVTNTENRKNLIYTKNEAEFLWKCLKTCEENFKGSFYQHTHRTPTEMESRNTNIFLMARILLNDYVSHIRSLNNERFKFTSFLNEYGLHENNQISIVLDKIRQSLIKYSYLNKITYQKLFYLKNTLAE